MTWHHSHVPLGVGGTLCCLLVFHPLIRSRLKSLVWTPQSGHFPRISLSPAGSSLHSTWSMIELQGILNCCWSGGGILPFGPTLKNILRQAGGKSKRIPAGSSAQWSPETPNQARVGTLHQARSKSGKTIFNLTSIQTQSVLSSWVDRVAFRAGTFGVAEWHPCKWRLPVQTEEGFISRAPLCCCHCLSLLCFHLSALGRKREGNTFRMEETSQTECRLSKLKMYLCQSLPSYCHFYFPSLSLPLSAPPRLQPHLKFCFCKSLAWCGVKLGAGLMRMAAVSGYLVNNVKSCDDALTLTLILLLFFF